MKAQYGSKRKLSFRYLCWLCGSLILFIAFFLVLVFSCDIFEDIETAEIIRINTDNDGLQEIIFFFGGWRRIYSLLPNANDKCIKSLS